VRAGWVTSVTIQLYDSLRKAANTKAHES
jgi:hypothetical protein